MRRISFFCFQTLKPIFEYLKHILELKWALTNGFESKKAKLSMWRRTPCSLLYFIFLPIMMSSGLGTAGRVPVEQDLKVLVVAWLFTQSPLEAVGLWSIFLVFRLREPSLCYAKSSTKGLPLVLIDGGSRSAPCLLRISISTKRLLAMRIIVPIKVTFLFALLWLQLFSTFEKVENFVFHNIQLD